MARHESRERFETDYHTLSDETRKIELSRLIRNLRNRLSLPQTQHLKITIGTLNLVVFYFESPTNFAPCLCAKGVFYVLNGRMELADGQTSRVVAPGDAMMTSHDIPANLRILTAAPTEPALLLQVEPDIETIRTVAQTIKTADAKHATGAPRQFSVATSDCYNSLNRLLELNGNAYAQDIFGDQIVQEIYIRLLSSPIGHALRKLASPSSRENAIHTVIEHVQANYHTRLDNAQLCAIAAMSGPTFQRHFKAVTGLPPQKYIKDFRLIEASKLIASKAFSVSETAFEVGYKSPSQFSRDYKRKFGHPPSKATEHGPSDKA